MASGFGQTSSGSSQSVNMDVATLSSIVASAVQQALQQQQQSPSPSAPARPSDASGIDGRPRTEINLDVVEYLRGDLHLDWVKVAKIIGVSRSTIHRRMKEANMTIEAYSVISDHDLESTVRSIKEHHPNCGEIMLAGHLARQGIRVTRARLRACIHKVDPYGVRARRLTTIKRRQYRVAHPNSVWHIDSNHKLIRWRLIVHGAIDGFSRKIIYLHCANNNKACTVVEQFSKAVSELALPDYVRSDMGGENIDVWRYMLFYYNEDASHVITGSSTHNERIERLWKDVYRCVCHMFYESLVRLEEARLLDPLNDVDLFCVHFVFVPLINRTLAQFLQSWNYHRLSTEHNMTPEQLYTIGLMERQQVQQPVSTSNWQQISTSHALLPVQSPEVVMVPDTPRAICQHLESQLNSLNCVANDFGYTLYSQVISTVGRHMVNSTCTMCFQ